jgi:hypothetical protein
MANLPKELKHFLARYDEKPQSLALKLREIVMQELAPCHEYIFAMRSKVVLLYGTSEKVIADGICSIAVFRQHVTLTFVEGVELDDPRHVLRGSGKTMRHLRVGAVEDLTGDDVRDFLRQARSLAGLPSPQGADRDKITTRVKLPAARTVRRRLVKSPNC